MKKYLPDLSDHHPPPDPDTDDVSSDSDDSSAYATHSDPDETESDISVSDVDDVDDHQIVCDVLFAKRHGDADDYTNDKENVVLAELEGKEITINFTFGEEGRKRKRRRRRKLWGGALKEGDRRFVGELSYGSCTFSTSKPKNYWVVS